MTSSLLMPENMTLKMTSALFGVASTLLMLTSGLFKNTIGEVYNMKIFLVTKILSLEEKHEIFKIEFLRIINEFYKTNAELSLYLQEHLTEKYFSLLEMKLILIKERLLIKAYAADTILELKATWERAQLLAFEQNNTVMYSQYFKYILIGLGVLFVSGLVIRALTDNMDALRAGFNIVREGADLGAANAASTLNTQEITADCLEILKTQMPILFSTWLVEAVSEINLPITKAMTVIQAQLAEHEFGLSLLGLSIKNIQAIQDNAPKK